MTNKEKARITKALNTFNFPLAFNVIKNFGLPVGEYSSSDLTIEGLRRVTERLCVSVIQNKQDSGQIDCIRVTNHDNGVLEIEFIATVCRV